MKKPIKHTKSIDRPRSGLWKIVPTLGAATCLLPMTSWAILPDNLTLNVGDVDNDGQDEVVVLTKRSMRSSTNHKLMTWDSIAGYQEITPPEVRTYRGYVQDDPSMRVNANIEPGNVTMNANFSDGHNLNIRLTAVPVTISGADGTYDPGTGNTVVPFVEDRTSPTPNGYIIPRHTMRRLDYAVTINNDYFVGMDSSIEDSVARVEQRMNDTDFFYARDMSLAQEIGWMVVNLEDNPSTWHKEWSDIHKPNGAAYEILGKFKKPGGAGAVGRSFDGGRHTVGTLVAYSKSQGHELSHTLGGGHASSWGDVMSGSESAIGSGTVERMIGNAAIATEAQSPELAYGGPLPPFAMEDCVTMVMDTTLDIDVLENDYDGNGDSISISYVEAVTEKGGTAELVDGKVRYTPPAHWQGQDSIVYHVMDSTGIANRTGYVKVAVHNNGLATHIMLDETTGFVAHDVGPFQAHGIMDQEFTFDTNSVSGKVGTALERTAVDHIKASADFWGTGDPLNGDLSVSLWVKYQSGVPTEKGPVICKGGAVIRSRFGNPRGGWAIGHTDDGQFSFEGNLTRDSDETYSDPKFDLQSTTGISDNTWHHLVMVMDRDTKQLRAWVDNQEVTSTTYGTTIEDGVIDSSHRPLVIYDSTSQQQQSTDFPMTVDDVQIYHKALSAAEVADLFNNPNADVAAGAPSPANGATDAIVGQDLTWVPGKTSGYDYDVYFGTDYDTVLNATTASPEYQGQQAGTSYTPSITDGTRYFWRIDQVGGATTVAGDVWWFEGESFSPLNDPAILNASVEDPALASGALSNDINDWFDATSYTWTQDDGSSEHPDTPYGDNWIELGNGRWIYQQIGTYQEDMDLDISFLAGQPDGNNFNGITVELLVGGDPALAADHKSKRDDASFALEDAVGATVIASSGQLNPFPSSGQATVEMNVQFSTGTGHSVGDPLWLLLYRPSSSGRSLIDNVQVVHTNAGPTNSDPVFNANPISEEYVTVGEDYNSSLSDNVSDPDGDTLTFTKVSGPAWLVIGTDGELTGVPAVGDDGLNTFTVQIDDGNGGVATTQVEIDVLPDTKAPGFPQNLAANAGDGTVSLDWDDNSETDFASYTLSRSTTSGSGYVAIATGLTVSDYVDNSAANGTTYYYVVTALDTSGNASGDSSEASASPVEPNVAPVASNATHGVAENSSVGTSVGSVVATDGNAADTLSYAITAGNGGGEFAINSSTGEITTATVLNYEAVTQYILTVTVSDNGNPVMSDTATITVNVTNVNEAPSASNSAGSLAENGSAGAAVATVSASDVDAGDSLSYAITAGNGSGLFAIDANGNVTTTGALDFESASQHVLTVTVTDNGSLTATATVTVTVSDVNEAPSASNAAGSLAENGSAGAAVTTVSASDVDAGDSLSYAITAGNGSGLFAIDASGYVTTTGAIDFESASQHVLTVTVTDSGSLTDTASVTVDVTDENESPVANNDSGNVAEGATTGTQVLTVAASDVDAGDSLSYAITAGNTGNAFAIDNNGNVTTASALDFETTEQYVLTVTVTDTGSLTDTATIIVDVTNENEAPVADDNSGSVAEDVTSGTNVLTVAASDVDAGDSLSYAITAGNTGNAFAIDSNGTITTASALDFETTERYVLTVTVTDSGSLTDTATVTIDVTDVVEITAPVIATGTASNLTQTEADIAYSVTDDGGEAPTMTLYYGESDGGQSAGSWDNSVALGVKATGSYNESLSGLTEGTEYYFTVHAANSEGEAWGSSASFTTEADSSTKMVRTTVSSVSSTTWVNVDLGQNYNSAVIVATPMYPDSSGAPVVTRVRNVSGSSFDLKLDRADGQTAEVTYDVSVLAVEEGVYTLATDGVQMEAVKFTSTVTARKSNWNAEVRSYQNSYTNPVVLGQVMSANDSNWSAFWSMGSSRTNPANASNLAIGKHVGEDSNTSRSDETVGYIVIESGNGTIDGVAYEAGLGADLPEGVGETSTGWDYSLSGSLTTASVAVLSQSAMDGNDGSWAVLYGATPFSTTTLTTAVEEDQIKDSERNHSTEQVSYLIFE